MTNANIESMSDAELVSACSDAALIRQLQGVASLGACTEYLGPTACELIKGAAARIRALAADSARLEFVLRHQAFISRYERKVDGVKCYALWAQGKGENVRVLSGDKRAYATEREAIDEAMRLEREESGA
jgi:hypothetical protein